MTDPLTAYRDDGPLARLAARAFAVPASSLLLTILGVVAAAAGLLADHATTGTASVVGIAVLVLAGVLGGAGRRSTRVQWLVPPLLRGGEYGVIAVLAHRTGYTETWLAYALLAVVAFHQYDIVYRLRHQLVAPAATITILGGGWEGRTILMTVATLSGALTPVLVGVIVWCGALFVSESMRSWVVLALDETRRSHVGVEVEEEEVDQ